MRASLPTQIWRPVLSDTKNYGSHNCFFVSLCLSGSASSRLSTPIDIVFLYLPSTVARSYLLALHYPNPSTHSIHITQTALPYTFFPKTPCTHHTHSTHIQLQYIFTPEFHPYHWAPYSIVHWWPQTHWPCGPHLFFTQTDVNSVAISMIRILTHSRKQ